MDLMSCRGEETRTGRSAEVRIPVLDELKTGRFLRLDQVEG